MHKNSIKKKKIVRHCNYWFFSSSILSFHEKFLGNFINQNAKFLILNGILSQQKPDKNNIKIEKITYLLINQWLVLVHRSGGKISNSFQSSIHSGRAFFFKNPRGFAERTSPCMPLLIVSVMLEACFVHPSSGISSQSFLVLEISLIWQNSSSWSPLTGRR